MKNHLHAVQGADKWYSYGNLKGDILAQLKDGIVHKEMSGWGWEGVLQMLEKGEVFGHPESFPVSISS